MAFLAVIVLYAAVCRTWWLGQVDEAYQPVLERVQSEARAAESEDEESGAEPGHDARAALRAYGAGPRRVGSTTVRFREDSDGLASAAVTHSLTLEARDPLLRELRIDDVDLMAEPFFPRLDLSTSCFVRNATLNVGPGERITQRTPRGDARVVVRYDTQLGSDDCLVRLRLTARSDAGTVGGKAVFDRWTASVRHSDLLVQQVRGTVTEHQSAHRADIRLPGRGTATLTLARQGDVPDERSGRGGLSAFADYLQDDYGAGYEPVLAATAVLVALTGCLLPALRSRTPLRRWRAAAWSCAGVTCVMTLLVARDRLNVSGFTVTFGESELPPLTVLNDFAVTTLLITWAGLLLPLLALAAAVRFTSGRAPGVRSLLPLLVPSVLLLAGPAALAITPGTAAAAAVPLLALPAVLATALALRRGLGGAGRRWAVTGAAASWLLYAGTVAVTGLPVADRTDYRTSTWELANTGVGLFLLWAWIPAFLVVARHAVRRRLRPVLTALAVFVAWYAVGGEYVHDLIAGEGMNPVPYGLPTVAWQLVVIDRRVFAVLVVSQVFLGALAAIVLYLRARGRRPGRWPSLVRPAVVGLGLLAALSHVMAWPYEVWEVGGMLGVVVAVVGVGRLLPPARRGEAERLLRLPDHAHNRTVHALLRDQTLETSRREFHQSSRAELADGSLTPRTWTERWNSLGALGPHGLAPRRSANLRRVALGTAGGFAPWRNAVAAAVLLFALSVPWLLYTVPSVAEDNDRLLFVALWALRWPMYGMVYGYAYPWLRGRSPLGKAMCLLAVVLPVELLQLLDEGQSPGDFGLSALATTGNALAVFLVLGLFWEARMVRAACLRWGQIRNFRTVSALAVPTTTILIAAVTAFVTAFAGTWATGVVQDGGGPQPSPASSTSPSPSPSERP